MPGMICPLCQSTLSDVIESRPKEATIIRKRRCINGHTYKTAEVLEEFPEPAVTARSLLLQGKSIVEVEALTGLTLRHIQAVARTITRETSKGTST